MSSYELTIALIIACITTCLLNRLVVLLIE